MTLTDILALSPDWWGMGNMVLFLGNFGNNEKRENGSKVLQRTDDGFIGSFFFSTGGMAHHTPYSSPSPKGFREMASVHSEMTGRRGGWHAVLSQHPVTGQSIISQEPEDATSQEKGRFPLLHGKVPKDVFVIFCLEKRQDCLFEHLNWPQNPIICIYRGHFVGCYLEKKHRKSWFQTQHSTRKWKFHCSFLT